MADETPATLYQDMFRMEGNEKKRAGEKKREIEREGEWPTEQ